MIKLSYIHILFFFSKGFIYIHFFRYGQPASEATNDTLSTIGNVVTVNSNLKVITPKGFAKTAAKSTGIALADGYKSGSQSTENIYHTMITPVPRSSSNITVSNINNEQLKPSTSGTKNNVIKKKE